MEPRAVSTPPPSFATQLKALPAAQRREAVHAHIVHCARHVLGLDTTISILDEVPLKEVGLDSLTAMELRNALARSMSLALPATLLFDYPSVERLVPFLLRGLGEDPVATSAPPTRETVDALTQRSVVAALSDDEAEAQLLAELEQGASGGSRV
jgi:acyl carrier protein